MIGRPRYNEIAAEFVRLKVNIILTTGTPQVVAAKQATSVIPIVFAMAGDPVANGLVASLARPGGNVTGLSTQSGDIAGKRLEILREVVPGLRRVAIMANISNPFTVLELGEVQAAASAGGLMSYGVNYPDLFQHAADYVDRILRGANPGDLPVQQPTKFDLVVNLTTAKASSARPLSATSGREQKQRNNAPMCGYSNTSSARAISEGGTVRPSDPTMPINSWTLSRAMSSCARRLPVSGEAASSRRMISILMPGGRSFSCSLT
jgi:hypothetical protein